MPEAYYGLDDEEMERAKEIVRGDLDEDMHEAAIAKTLLLQLELFDRIARQLIRVADSLERLEGQ